MSRMDSNNNLVLCHELAFEYKTNKDIIAAFLIQYDVKVEPEYLGKQIVREGFIVGN